MGLNVKNICCSSIGFILILCQHHYCDEPLTSSVKSPSESETTGSSSTKSTLSSTAFETLQSVESVHQNVTQTKKSIISTTTPQTTLLHQASVTQPDQTIKDVTSSIENLCLLNEYNTDDKLSNPKYSMKSVSGDITVTIILDQSDNSTEIIHFIVNHINEIDLLVHSVSIGVRIVKILQPQYLMEILENEIDFLENCVHNPFGIFLSNELWQNEREGLKGKSFEFKIWPMPVVEKVRARKAAQLLNDLPLPAILQNASVELRLESSSQATHFESTLKTENLCIKKISSATKIYVYVGHADFLNKARFELNMSLIIVPLSMRDIMMSRIPDHSFVAIESEIYINEFSKFTTLPSEFITVASTFLEICKSINNAIWKNCDKTSPTTKLNLENCKIFNDLHAPEEIYTSDIKHILKMLQLQSLENKMMYNIFEKLTSNSNESSVELKKIVSTNFITNVATVYMSDQQERVPFGYIVRCEKVPSENISHSSQNETHGHDTHVDSFEMDAQLPTGIRNVEFDDMNRDIGETHYWKIRSELWVAIGVTVSTLGILLCLAILTFIIVRVCLEDVLEGNPIGSVVLLIALIAQFATFLPFTIEYADFRKGLNIINMNETFEVYNTMCIIRIFVVSVSYSFTFSLILSRAIMLASIGSEGGFLSHVNGYIQSIICIFSFLVQFGLSTQLLVMLFAHQRHTITCLDVYYGNWFWGIIGYNAMLLVLLTLLTPLIYRSHRNYREGILIATTSVLCLVCWSCWIPLSLINSDFREMMIPLGCQATGWIILSSLMVPRCFLIVRSIARSDLTQALPSLTSLAFAQANHSISEPSIYECVNPIVRTRSSDDTSQANINEYLSPSEVPTLPLRGGGGRRNHIEGYNINFNEIVNPTTAVLPNKMTRF